MSRSVAASSALAVLVPAVALLVASATGCDLAPRVSSDPAGDQWAEVQPRAQAQLSRLREQETVVTRRMQAVKVPDGAVDPQLSQLIEGMAKYSQTITTAVTTFDNTLTRVTGEVEQARSGHNKIAARRAVEQAATELDQAGTAARQAIESGETLVKQAEAIMQRAQGLVDADLNRLRKIATEGGSADIFDIVFIEGTSRLDPASATTSATMQRIATVAGMCDQLRLTITVHTARDGEEAAMRALSTARANQIRTSLINAGVAAAKIHRAVGAGYSAPLVDEPAPGTPDEDAVPPDELDGRRRKNRRVTLTVDTPCPVAAAQVAPPPDSDAPEPPPSADPPTTAAPAAGNRVRPVAEGAPHD